MDDMATFTHAVHNASELPSEVRGHADEVKAVSRTLFDQTHIDLLDTQIRLNSRGPAWAAQLRKRRDAMSPYCNIPLLKGRIEIGVDAYWIMLDPTTGKVVYWELYERWSERLSR